MSGIVVVNGNNSVIVIRLYSSGNQTGIPVYIGIARVGIKMYAGCAGVLQLEGLSHCQGEFVAYVGQAKCVTTATTATAATT